MRICIIAPPWVPVPPRAYGGTEAVLDALARGLHDAGHEVLLVTTGDATCPVPTTWTYAEAVGIGVGGPAAELRHVIHAYEAASTFGADVVHDHTIVGPIYARYRGAARVVTTNHGPFDAPDLLPYYRAIAGDIPVIAISHDHASKAPMPVAAVIHHGIDVDRYPVGDGAGGFAAFLGRMHPDKGVDAACRIARAAGMPLKIAAKMGEPHEVAYFDAAVRPLLGGDVEYIGEVGHDDKLALLGAASCLLNPIRWLEPFGMVMVEALACGTPVVARTWGSAPELVDDGVTGLLGDSDADLIRHVPVAVGLDRAVCRRTAEVRFSAARMVAEHVAVYARLAPPAPSTKPLTLTG